MQREQIQILLTMTDLFSVYDKLSPEPLQEKDLDCYVDTYQGRGGVRPVSTLKRLLGYNREGILPDGKLPDRELQILFSGYKGCGKSTELNKLQYENKSYLLLLRHLLSCNYL